jgi:uncharacterized protein YgbK (DUF1537 family)
MSRFALLADDLTGALTSASQLKNVADDVDVVWSSTRLPPGSGPVVVNMQSRDERGLHRDRARAWTRRLAAAGFDRFECRMDSTLAGHTRDELAGLLDGLGQPDYPVIAIPAYPEAGRVTVDGIQHIRNAGERPRQIDVAALAFGRPADRVITVKQLAADSANLATEILRTCERPAARVVVDATADEHLEQIGAALELCDREELRYVTTSPGRWLRYLRLPRRRSFTLVVVASPTQVNARQRTRLLATPGVRDVTDRPRPTPSAWWDHVLAESPTIVLSSFDDVVSTDQRDPLQAKRAARSAVDLVREADRAGWSCRRLIATGGMAAEELLALLEPDGLEISASVGPMCTLATVSAEHGSIEYVTKGGQMGDDDTLVKLASFTRHSRITGEPTP